MNDSLPDLLTTLRHSSFLRFKISPGQGETKLVSTYKPGLWDVDTGVKQRDAVDPAIHLLVQHGADTNKKDRSVGGVLPVIFLSQCK